MKPGEAHIGKGHDWILGVHWFWTSVDAGSGKFFTEEACIEDAKTHGFDVVITRDGRRIEKEKR